MPSATLFLLVAAHMVLFNAVSATNTITPPFRSVSFERQLQTELSSLPACPDGICPGLGNGFPLWRINALSINTGGAIFFTNKSLGSCAKVSQVEQSVRKFTPADSMEQFNRHVMTQSGLSGSITASAFTASGTAEVITSQKSSITTSFHSVQMDIQVATHSVDFQADSACFSKKNLDPQFLHAFESLPIISDPSQSSPWHAYTTFMSKYGSHIMTQQIIGSRFQQWESSTSSDADISETLQIKACAQVEGVSGSTGWSVDTCSQYTKEQKERALRVQSNMARVISGGTDKSRAALTAKVSQANLDNFINSAPQGNQPIRFSFSPIWDLIYFVYAEDCANAGKNSKPCQFLQRAVTLQAAYEGWLSIPGGCETLKDNRQQVYQTMAHVGAPDQHGISVFGCHLSKTGCRSDDDCHLGGAGSVCYCYGKGCINSGEQVPLLDGHYRDKVQGDKRGSYNEGVNNACYYHFIAHCDCDKGWAGGLPDRFIYSQSTSFAGFGDTRSLALAYVESSPSEGGEAASEAAEHVEL